VGQVCEAMYDEDVVPLIVNLLNSGDAFAQEYAARIVLNMCSDGIVS